MPNIKKAACSKCPDTLEGLPHTKEEWQVSVGFAVVRDIRVQPDTGNERAKIGENILVGGRVAATGSVYSAIR